MITRLRTVSILLVVVGLVSVAYDTAGRVFVSAYATEFCAVATARPDAERLLPAILNGMNVPCLVSADAPLQPPRSLTYFEAEPAAAIAWTVVIVAGVSLAGFGLYRLMCSGRGALISLCAGTLLLVTWAAIFEYGNPSRDYERLLFSSVVVLMGTLCLLGLTAVRVTGRASV